MKKLLIGATLLVLSFSAFAVVFTAKGNVRIGPYESEEEVVAIASDVLPSIKDGSHHEVQDLARENNCGFFKKNLSVGALSVEKFYIEDDNGELKAIYRGLISFKIRNCRDY